MTPDMPVNEVTASLFWLAFMLRLFWLGVPLSVLGPWCHGHPTPHPVGISMVLTSSSLMNETWAPSL